MDLLSYAQTALGARLTVITRAQGEFVPPGIEPGGMYRPFAVFPVHRFTALLSFFAATAIEQHELPAREDPGRLAFELHAILLGADTKFVLHDDPAVLDLARQVVRQRLGLDNGGNAGGS